MDDFNRDELRFSVAFVGLFLLATGANKNRSVGVFSPKDSTFEHNGYIKYQGMLGRTSVQQIETVKVCSRR